MIRYRGIKAIHFGPTPPGIGTIEYNAEDQKVRLFPQMGILENDELLVTHTTGNKTWLEQTISRETIRSTWDGNPDDVLSIQNQNWVDNADIGAIRAAMFKTRQGNSPNSLYWMRTVDIELDNRGDLVDKGVALRVGVRSNSPNVGVGITGIELEMLGQAAPTSGYERAIDLIHNDLSSVTYPTAISLRGARATNGFVYAIATQEYGLDKKGQDSADSAVFKFFDDSENVDLDNGSVLNDINATANAGWMKVVIGSTVRYVALYAKKG